MPREAPPSAAGAVRPLPALGPSPRAGRSWLHAPLLALGALAVALLICSFAIHKLDSVDFWWQLRLGKYITELHEVPTTDIFTYTAKGKPYVDSHWLFQMALWLVYRWGGIDGVILAVAAAALATWLVVAATAWRRDAYGVLLAALAVGAVAASERYVPRPDLVSVLFLAIAHGLVRRYRDTGSAAVYVLPVLGLVWVNAHGLWILGPIVIAAYVVGDAVAHRAPVPAGWRERAMPAQRVRVLALVGVATVAAAFVTPQPLKQALYPVTLFREIQEAGNWVEVAVTELAAPLAEPHWATATWAFVVLGAAFVLGVLANWRRLDLSEAAVGLMFAYVALTARRNIALFAVVAVPIVVRLWADRPRARAPAPARGRTPGLGQPVLAALAAGLALGVAWAAATNRLARRDGTLRRFGLGLHETLHPGGLGDAIAAIQPPGRIWNSTGLGGYLEWRFWPERETFIDGRWEIYGEDFLRAYTRSLNDFDAWQRMADQYGINTVVIMHRRPYYATLMRSLNWSRDWTPLHIDAAAVMFVRRESVPIQFIRRNRVRFDRTPVPTQPRTGTVVGWEDRYQGRPRFAGLETWLDRWPPRPADPLEALLLGNLFFNAGEDGRAAEQFATVVRQRPRDFTANLSLGFLRAEHGDLEGALRLYHTAAAARPWEPDGWRRVGATALALGYVTEAQQAYGRLARLQPDDPDAWTGLARAALAAGDRAAARRHLDTLRRVAPHAPGVAALERALAGPA